jgi:glycine/D-amino acid oxidase-like deaminating enzyme
MDGAALSRRRMLALMGGSALALGLGGRLGAATPKQVVVIGAGILGAAIGYELAKRGAQVTILEKNAPASATTGDSFAYLNASTKTASRPYFDLNWQGMAGWHRWQREFDGALPLQWGGSVYWRDQEAAAQKLAATLATARQWGYGGEAIDQARLHQLLPGLAQGGFAGGAYYEEEGAVDPALAVELLLQRSRQLGAKVLYPAQVESFAVEGGRVRGVRTRQGDIEADAVVVAAGLGSQALAAMAGVKLPLTHSQGVLVRTKPAPRLLDRVVFGPHGTVRQMRDGRILGSIGHEGANLDGDGEAQGRRILASLARQFPQIGELEIDRVSLGQRVLPADSFPVVGFAPGVAQLYLAVSHSGVTLAPAIGRFAAQEVLEGIGIDGLAPFRPGRFA